MKNSLTPPLLAKDSNLNRYVDLATYSEMIESTTTAEWCFRPLKDFTDSVSHATLLRHDIDAELYLLDPFLDAERSRLVTATYFLIPELPFYNLRSPDARAVID